MREGAVKPSRSSKQSLSKNQLDSLVEYYNAFSARPVRDADSELIEVNGYWTEITERLEGRLLKAERLTAMTRAFKLVIAEANVEPLSPSPQTTLFPKAKKKRKKTARKKVEEKETQPA